MEVERKMRRMSDSGPDVIPMKVLGCMDSDTGGMSNAELLREAIRKVEMSEEDGPYAIRHSWEAVSEFPPRKEGNGEGEGGWVNHIASCYPTLFPYGEGGIEDAWEVKVPYAEHARCLLLRHDYAFCTHHSFLFTVFSILQKRQLIYSARLQMNSATFQANARLLASLSPRDLKEAEEDEAANRPNANPRIRALKNQMHATANRVMGSDESRASYRSQIWGTTLYMRPPSLWMTINLSDMDEPVIQIFCGEEIDMDKFDRMSGPDADERARNVAKNPLAAAEGFHFLMGIILETLIGVSSTGKTTKSKPGVLGTVSAYFGVVEAQGRGTIHLHLIMWLADAPNTDEMVSMLDTEEFREKMKKYIQSMICADLPGIKNEEDVKRVKKVPHLAYSRPPDPSSATYLEELRTMEHDLARSQQVHTCKTSTCLNRNRKGKLVCKRRAPFTLSDDHFVEKDGKWGVRRLYGYLNSWCPNLTCQLRANHDLKVTTNGADTRDGAFYITSYATKKQCRSYNRSAITAKAHAYHVEKEKEEEGKALRDRNRLLLFRAVNMQNRQQELSAPQAMSYVMAWGDVYRSHHYAPLFWAVLRRALLREFPALGNQIRAYAVNG